LNAFSVRRFAVDDGRRAWRQRDQLELEAVTLGRWPTLSRGERKRWQVGAALHAEPDRLLLDEPTNHLDAAARRILVRALERFRGTGVVVSHDREFTHPVPHPPSPYPSSSRSHRPSCTLVDSARSAKPDPGLERVVALRRVRNRDEARSARR
jgi:hypothetical protein